MISINAFGGPRDSKAYTVTAIIIAVLGAGLMILSGLKVKERVELSKKIIPFKENLKTLTKNKKMMFLIVMILLINLCLTLRAAVGMYNAMYVLNNPGAMSILGLVTAGGMIIGMCFTPMLTKRMSIKAVMTVFCAVGAATSLLPFLIDPTKLLVVIISNLFHNICNGILMVVSSTMLLDMVDLSECILGFRGDGIAFSTNTFITKLASTFSKLIAGAGMIIIGYSENQVTSPLVISTFSILSYIIPAVCLALVLIPLHFYKYSKTDREKTLKELETTRV